MGGCVSVCVCVCVFFRVNVFAYDHYSKFDSSYMIGILSHRWWSVKHGSDLFFKTGRVDNVQR